MRIGFHPAPGLGDLLPGFFIVPNNPLWPRIPLARVAHIGELMPARFTVPQNPLVHGGGGLAGCGCGCGGSCGCKTLDGLGDVSTALQSVTSTIQSGWAGLMNTVNASMSSPTTKWLLIGGGALLVVMMLRPGGSQYRSKLRSARARYREEKRRLRSEYPRVGSRARRAAEAF